MHNIHCECLCDMWAFFRCHSLSNFNFCSFRQNKSNCGPSAQLEFSFVSLNCHQKKREKSSCAFTLTAVLFCWNLARSFQQCSKKKENIHPSTHTASPTVVCESDGSGACWWIVQRLWLIPSLPWETSATKENRMSPLLFSLDFYYPWRRNHSRWSSLVRLIHIHRSYIMKHTHTLEAVQSISAFLAMVVFATSHHPTTPRFPVFSARSYFFALKVHFWRQQQILICPEKLWIDFFSPRRQCKVEFVFNLQNKFKTTKKIEVWSQ